MNILDYINDSNNVEKLTVHFDGKDLEFCIKNLTQAEVEKMTGEQAKLLPIYKKQQKEEELTPDEVTMMLSYQSDQAFNVLCTETGAPLFETKEQMKGAISGRLFKAISQKIIDHNGTEEAEKN